MTSSTSAARWKDLPYNGDTGRLAVVSAPVDYEEQIMTTRRLAFSVSSTALAVLMSTAAGAQSDRGSGTLRTLDGHPDLSGLWDFRTVTPLERPENLSDQ